MEDPKPKEGGPQGVGVPAKGDSSAGNVPQRRNVIFELQAKIKE